MTTNLHAHVATFSRDCDGGHGNEYTTGLNDVEMAQHFAAEERGYNDFHDLAFKARVLSAHTFFSTEFGVTLKVDSDGFRMDERTDEGYRGAEVRWCEDADCDPNAEGPIYDEFAQAAGY